ncbi:putative DNA-binding protein [Clostridium sp. 19966]|uniref:putative DNA-binding protein n=1 Tax=Clostridium sp. 19966 TaxID=2768166 RepID=UPI0028DFAEC4|nr:putative DNA-binding protein [Clostridium sp. 19966]MDT8716447.1 putative DNA-binding protein [Clostridium sp. 19966]
MLDIVEGSLLLDFYGSLLTDKQFNILDMYYNENLSLAEISEITSTSRQAIHDIIKRCNKQLTAYEEKLKLIKNSKEIKKLKKSSFELLDKLEQIEDRLEKKNIINEIKEKINMVL